ncbi:hypothetical protein JCM8547_002060 [Rhodosporidiobolus lusitaniae]
MATTNQQPAPLHLQLDGQPQDSKTAPTMNGWQPTEPHSASTVPAEPDLATWAPDSPPFEQLPPSGKPSYLPQASGVHVLGGKKPAKKGSTSKPFNAPLTPLQSSISYSLARLLSFPRFVAFLHTPLGYAQVHSYLTSQAPGGKMVSELELWHDLHVLKTLTRQAGFASKGISNVYLDPDAPSHVSDLPKEDVLKPLVSALKSLTAGTPGLEPASKHLLHSLYEKEFEGFVKLRLLKHTKAQLSKYHLSPDDRGRSGIGSAFLITNPRLPDDPIVLVSTGFSELTGYTPAQIIGRNCRFLQGKATAPQSVADMRARLEMQEEVTQVVLNYRASGEPFINLVCIIPLRDTSGMLTYFIGGQTDVTRALTTGSDLSFILPGDEQLSTDMSNFSQAVQVEAHDAQTGSIGAPDGGPDLTIHEVPPTPPADEPHEPHELEQVKSRASVVPDGASAKTGKSGKSKKEKDVGIKQLLSLKRHTTSLFKGKKAKASMKQQQQQAQDEEPFGTKNGEHPNQPLVAPTMTDPTTMPFEKRMLDVQMTYEKLAVVRKSTSEILFCTSGFLRFVGLPGTSRAEIEDNVLIHRNLVDLVIAPEAPSPTSVPTKELRNKIKTAISEAVTFSIPCGVQVREVGKQYAFSFPGRIETTPIASGRIHIAPLLDLYGSSSAATVVFG